MSLSTSLAATFAKARPVRWASLFIAIVVAAMLCLLLVVQAFQTSGTQEAMTATGRYLYSLRIPTTMPLGTDNGVPNKNVREAMKTAGASSSTSGYFAGQLPVDEVPDIDANVRELDWQMHPHGSQFPLVSGSLPHAPGEAVVTTALKKKLPTNATRISFGYGSLDLEIVGVVRNEDQRDALVALVAPGTWASADQSQASQLGLSGSRVFLWNSDAPQHIVDAIVKTLKPSIPDLTTDDLLSSVSNQRAIKSDSTSLYSELTLLLLTAPFAAGLIGGWVASRFITRIRRTMLYIGVTRTRAAGTISLYGSATLGTVAGIAGGIALGLGLRPLLNKFSVHWLGPVYGLTAIVPTVLVAVLLGLTCGLVRMRTGEKTPLSQRLRARGVPSLLQLTPALSIALLIAGVIAAQSGDTNVHFLSAYFFGFAVVLLLPPILSLLTRMRGRRLPVIFALRRMQAEIASIAWASFAIAAILMLSFSITVMFYSQTSTINESSSSRVPAGQVQVTLPESVSDTSSMRADLEKHLGIHDPIFFDQADVSPQLGDGAVMVVNNYHDLERLLSITLTDEQINAFTSGAVLHPKETVSSDEEFTRPDDSTFTLPLVEITGVGPSYARYGGFVSEATAEEHDVDIVRSNWVYTDVTEAQRDALPAALDATHINPDWVREYTAPSRMTEPPQMVIVSAVAGLLAGLILAYLTATIVRSLRPRVAALRTIGVNRRWLTTALSVQIGTVAATSLIFACLSSLAAIASAIYLWAKTIRLHIPWVSLCTVLGALVIIVVATAVIAAARVSSRERLSEH